MAREQPGRSTCLPLAVRPSVRLSKSLLSAMNPLSGQDQGEYLQFLQRSNEEALKEEERRHRFLAEKHCGLVQSITYLMNKVHWSYLLNLSVSSLPFLSFFSTMSLVLLRVSDDHDCNRRHINKVAFNRLRKQLQNHDCVASLG